LSPLSTLIRRRIRAGTAGVPQHVAVVVYLESSTVPSRAARDVSSWTAYLLLDRPSSGRPGCCSVIPVCLRVGGPGCADGHAEGYADRYAEAFSAGPRPRTPSTWPTRDSAAVPVIDGATNTVTAGTAGQRRRQRERI